MRRLRRLLNVLKAENDRDIYLVFEYKETDLHAGAPRRAAARPAHAPLPLAVVPTRATGAAACAVIRANILEEIHKQYVMYQARALGAMPASGL